MPKISKRIVDAAEPGERDYFIWDSELVGFAVRVLPSGRRTYTVQYRAKGRTRRFTIGAHGVWTPDTARKEARILLGRIAQGDNPAEEKHLDAEAITVRELCERYLADCEAGLVLGKKRRPKRPSTLKIDRSRIHRHIVPLLGNRKVKDLTSTDIMQFLRDVAAGKTRADVKTVKHGRAIVRGGIGTAARGVGLIGGIFTYAIREGIIEKNPAHGIRKAADRVRDRRLAFGQSRALLVWNRIIFPNGRSIVLERQPGADVAGFAGLQDGVDNHWGQIFRAGLVSTLLSVGTEAGSGDDESELLRAIRRGSSDSISQTGRQVVGRSLDVQPTLTIRPGFPVRVVVTRDLVLEPYRG